MEIIAQQQNIFDDNCEPLTKISTVLDNMNYEPLLSVLAQERGHGRNDYPNETMLRCYLAFTIFKYPTMQAFIDELKRNPALRMSCKLTIKVKANGSIQTAPSNQAFTRFEQRLGKHQELLNDIFNRLVTDIHQLKADFGQNLALDGKLIESYASRLSKSEAPDGRGETDANYTLKQYTGTKPTGEIVVKTITYFGFRLHLLVDTKYELPVLYRVTKASLNESTVAKDLIQHDFPEWLKRTIQTITADRGYDGRPLMEVIEKIRADQPVIPVIDIKNMWRDGEPTRQYRETDFVYNYAGAVFYLDENSQLIKAKYQGYHKQTDSLRYQTPDHQHQIYIQRAEDPRIFNRLARDSKKFKRIYQSRTAIERVNGRLDRDYLFENHTIRGLAKLNLRVTLSFIVMLSLKKAEFGSQDQFDGKVA